MNAQINSLAHFQQHSRLHFIGQWKTKAEDFLSALYQEHPQWNHGPLQRQALFIHLDMDAYFCSVALSKEENAAYRDKPVAIAAGVQNSDVSSCNYIARRLGIHAGMWVGEAKRLCPSLVVLGYDLALCEELNKKIYRVILSTAPHAMPISLEVYSVDEVVIATSCNDWDVVNNYCSAVREEIARVTNGCTASCGVAENIFLARLATGKIKPDRVLLVKKADVTDLLGHTPITELHGIGRVTLKKLLPLLQHPSNRSRVTFALPEPPGLKVVDQDEVTDERAKPPEDDPSTDAGAIVETGDRTESKEVPTCTALQSVTMQSLQDTIGKKLGEQLYALCRGIDHRLVKRTGDSENQTLLGRGIPNAVGCSMNYAVRPVDTNDVSHIIEQVVADVAAKLRRTHLCAKNGRLSILERHPDYAKTTTKFLGTGHCVEHHISVPFAAAVTGEQSREISLCCEKALFPRLTDSANTKLQEAERWILIEDIRGVTIQLSSLKAIIRRTSDSSEMGPRVPRSLGGGGMEGQLSLTAAFQQVQNRKRLRAEDTEVLASHEEEPLDDDDVEDDMVTSVHDDEATTVHSSLSATGTAGAAGSPVVEICATPLKEIIAELSTHLGSADLVPNAQRAVDECMGYGDLQSMRGLLRQISLWAACGSCTTKTYVKVHCYCMQRIRLWGAERLALPPNASLMFTL